MSTTIITIEEVTSVKPHPDADRLDVIEVLGYQVVTGKGNFKVGDHVIYFPPDIMIPPHQSEPLGVTQYLKHARMSNDTMKIQCRVGACRLRGLPSYGFCAPITAWIGEDDWIQYEIGQDLTSAFEGEKYEPPARLGGGDSEPDMPNFHRYTNIENIQRRNQFFDGEEIVITEKIHGTNCRMGYVTNYSGGPEEQPAMDFQAGSNKLRRKKGDGLYWSFFTENVREFLFYISRREGLADVILFGEIYGPGVQDMQYGEAEKKFRAFDCSVNGVYVIKEDFWADCDEYGIETVPVLYEGPYSREVVDKYTDGKSTYQATGKAFKGREGIVITPRYERADHRGNRVIAKSVSVDYLNRKGAEDNA